MPDSPRRRRGRPSSDHAAFRRVAADLRRRMLLGEWNKAGILPSLRSLALEYKVSLNVACMAMQVLHREGRVGRTPSRRLAVRRYRTPEPSMGPEGAILEIVTAPLHHMAGLEERDLQAGILAGVGALSAPLTMLHAYYLREALPAEYLELPWRGILLFGVLNPKLLKAYERMPIPVVLVDQPPGEARVHAACVDNAGAALEATQRLLDLGHRRIAFLRRLSSTRTGVDPDSLERQSGFQEALRRRAAKPIKPAILSCLSTETQASAVFQAAAGPRARFTALLCADSGLAGIARDAAHAAGKRIPEDLSIASFQQRLERPLWSGPSTDFIELGRRAAQLLARPARPAYVDRVPALWVDAGTVASPRDRVGRKA